MFYHVVYVVYAYLGEGGPVRLGRVEHHLPLVEPLERLGQLWQL
jgi:hypothetical protein